ncbi:MAG: M28 family peptidase [Rhodopirellula sp.]|nr:M28 family peptidase [Rhodopirellula sp.]
MRQRAPWRWAIWIAALVFAAASWRLAIVPSPHAPVSPAGTLPVAVDHTLPASASISFEPTAVEERLRDEVRYLASDTLEGRGIGTAGIDLAAEHIAEEFAAAGLRTDLYDGKPFQEFSVSGRRGGRAVKNVVAILDGRGPLAEEAIVLGAHYDHLGRGGSGSLAPGGREIHNGADDNASGTAVLNEVARQLAARQGDPCDPCRSLVFVAFTAEESGLIGSEYYVGNPLMPIKNTVAMVNFDMVGRLRHETLTICGNESSPAFGPLLRDLGSKYGFRVREIPALFGPSDHLAFYTESVPVLHFFTGLHKDYHRPSDDFEKLDYEGMRRIVEMSTELVLQLATNAARPEFANPFGDLAGMFSPITSAMARTGPRQAFFGVVRDVDHKPAGFAVRRVVTGSAAEKAGLRGGDVIVQFGDQPIERSEELTPAVRAMRPGERVQVRIERLGTQFELDVTLGAR